MGNVFFYRDEDGNKQDAAIHEDVLDNNLADLYFALRTIRQHMDDGHSFETSVLAFGTDPLRAGLASGDFTEEDLIFVLSDTAS